MRKIIEDQIKKVQYVDLSDLEEGKEFLIKKRVPTNFELDKEYVIELADDLLVKGQNEILECNFNHNRVPEAKIIQGEVQKILGKMILFIGNGFDSNGNEKYWNGYLPKDKIKIVKIL